MTSRILLLALFASSVAGAATPALPIRSGEYVFRHKDAEFPNQPGVAVKVRITGRHIVVINPVAGGVFPKGMLTEGTLVWHAQTREWIIATQPSDRDASEVGGCSEGPEVVDLMHRIYWTC